MSFKMLDQQPIGRLRRPDPRMPRWLMVLLGAVCFGLGVLLSVLLS
jgi:hypothetical protein